MPKATLEQWRMLKSVVDAGGFNQASKQVHKSQSSIHHAVHKLEEVLGIQLLSNEGRSVKLTEAGQIMYRRATLLLDEAHKLEEVATSLETGVEATLRIAADIVFPSSVLYRVLDKVSTEFPLLRIELMETALTGSNAMLKSGEVDIAISPFTYATGFSEDLCEIDFIAVAAPDHPLNQLDRHVSIMDLKGYRQIVIRDSSQERADSGWLGADQRWTVSHVRTSIDMICHGLGYAWLPIAIIRKQLDSGELKPLNLEQGSLRKTLMYLCLEDGDRLGPAARSFIGELRYESMNMPNANSLL